MKWAETLAVRSTKQAIERSSIVWEAVWQRWRNKLDYEFVPHVGILEANRRYQVQTSSPGFVLCALPCDECGLVDGPGKTLVLDFPQDSAVNNAPWHCPISFNTLRHSCYFC